MRTEHHPDEEELALYAHKQLPSEREKVVQDHLRNCYECSWKVVEARKLRYKQEACLLSKVTTEFRRQFKCLLTEKQKVVLILVFGHHSRRTVRLQGMRYQAKGRVLHLDDIIGQPLVSWERGELLLRFRGTVPSWIRVRCQDSEIQQKVPVSGTLGIKIPLPD